MQSLTGSEIIELQKFAAELSKPETPVRIEYEPPHVIAHFKRPGQRGLIDAHHGLLLSQHGTLELLKAAIKAHAVF